MEKGTSVGAKVHAQHTAVVQPGGRFGKADLHLCQCRRKLL
jgi:hypothetical protein